MVIDFLIPRSNGEQKELVLDADIYENSGDRKIIGLPSISDEKVWMVPRYDESFLFINHDIFFM